jgi:hypothetical protein
MFKFIKCEYKIHPKVDKIYTNWFCKIETFEQFEKYLKIRSKRIVQAYSELKNRDPKRDGHYKDDFQTLVGTTLIYSLEERLSVVDDVRILSEKLNKGIIKCFADKSHIIINENHGYRFMDDSFKVLDEKYDDNFVFPEGHLKKENIRIIQWPGGRHYYAKIGKIDIVDKHGDQKWFTHKEAYDAALKYLNKD